MSAWLSIMNELQINVETIVGVADTLFESQGYDSVTLATIAETAEMPLEIVTSAYESKVAIALAVYHRLAKQSLQESENLSYESFAERYYQLIEYNLTLLNIHQEAVSALFAAAMRPNSCVVPADISQGKHDPTMQAMALVVDGATDKPTKDSDELALVLYAFHFLVVIFWLYDRTEDKQASHVFTQFLREFFKLMRPMMMMPLVKKALNKMAKIVLLVFGGAKLVDTTTA